MANIGRPEGHHSITPGFVVPRVKEVISFLEKAFGGKVVDLYEGPNGHIMHAEVMIDGSVVMMGEPMPGWDPMPASLSYYVADGAAVDAVYKKAIDAGATSVMGPETQFYGYRSASVKDAGGNKWTICAVVEQLTREEMHRRMAEMSKG